MKTGKGHLSRDILAINANVDNRRWKSALKLERERTQGLLTYDDAKDGAI
jgi:hypothetical protein